MNAGLIRDWKFWIKPMIWCGHNVFGSTILCALALYPVYCYLQQGPGQDELWYIICFMWGISNELESTMLYSYLVYCKQRQEKSRFVESTITFCTLAII